MVTVDRMVRLKGSWLCLHWKEGKRVQQMAYWGVDEKEWSVSLRSSQNEMMMALECSICLGSSESMTLTLQYAPL